MFSPIISIQGNNTVSVTKVIIETHVAKQILELLWEDNLKDYNNITLHNGNNIKYNCDIYELPEGRFTLTI